MNVDALKAQIEQKNSEVSRKAETIAAKTLQKFENDLSEPLDSAVNTLCDDLGKAESAIRNELTNLSSTIRSQIEDERKSLLLQIACLKWMVLLPTGATALVCGVMIAAVWLWLPRELWNLSTARLSMSDGRSYLVIQDTQWKNCNLSRNPKASILRPCKTLDGNSR